MSTGSSTLLQANEVSGRSLNFGNLTLSSGGLLLPVCADRFFDSFITASEKEGCSFSSHLHVTNK